MIEVKSMRSLVPIACSGMSDLSGILLLPTVASRGKASAVWCLLPTQCMALKSNLYKQQTNPSLFALAC